MGHSGLENMLLAQRRYVPPMFIQMKGVIQDVIAVLEKSWEKLS